MTIADVKKKAKEMGIKAGRMNKADLIQAIQIAEGNSPCFGTAAGYCDQADCCWAEDCLAIR